MTTYSGFPLAFSYHDINEAYSELHTIKHNYAAWEETRNGRALSFPAPVLITHTTPYRRVLFDSKRDANPFFHYMEAIWMLAGAENVDFPALFAKNLRNYSDDGITLRGAYGYRWRKAFEVDQVEEVVYQLKKDPGSRRAVIGMWDPQLDLMIDSKDKPCNTHIYFRIHQNALHMTVCNRSNDLVWGMLGANMVHMSILQEYIAGALELAMGNYYQFTNNLHIYEGWDGEDKWSRYPSRWYYDRPTFNRWAFSPNTFDLDEAERFVEDRLDTDEPYRCRILRDNAEPMLLSWNAYKSGDDHLALHYAQKIWDADWKDACLMWLARRLNGKAETNEA